MEFFCYLLVAVCYPDALKIRILNPKQRIANASIQGRWFAIPILDSTLCPTFCRNAQKKQKEAKSMLCFFLFFFVSLSLNRSYGLLSVILVRNS